MPYNIQVYNGNDFSLHDVIGYQNIPDEISGNASVYSLSTQYNETLFSMGYVTEYGVKTVSKSFNKYFLNGAEVYTIETNPLKIFENAVSEYNESVYDNGTNTFKICEIIAKDNQVLYNMEGNLVNYDAKTFDNYFCALNYIKSLRTKNVFYCIHKIIGLDGIEEILYYFNGSVVDYNFIQNYSLVNYTPIVNSKNIGINGKVINKDGKETKLISKISLYASSQSGLSGYIQTYEQELRDLEYVIESVNLSEDDRHKIFVMMNVLKGLTSFMKDGRIESIKQSI